jgi:signal transduction histidine kinase
VEIAESVLSLQQGSIRKAGVELHTDLNFSQSIYAFPGELRQVFTNLISNAVEVLPRNGTLIIRIHAARDWRGGRDGYRIVIADNGPGIPEESRKKLFEPFYTTKGERGTGLGLWITRQLLHKHGGSIRFRSRHATPSRTGGTVFSVWLPLEHEFTNSPKV